MKLFKHVEIEYEGLKFRMRKMNAIDYLEFQMANSDMMIVDTDGRKERTQKEIEAIKKIADVLVSLVVDVEGLKDEDDQDVDYLGLSEKEKKEFYFSTMRFAVDLFSLYTSKAMSVSEDTKKKSSTLSDGN